MKTQLRSTVCLALLLLVLGWPMACFGQAFTHPGILHTQPDFDRMRDKVNAGEQPYLSGWQQLTNNPYSQAGWNPRPLGVVVRGGTGDNVAQLFIDVQRAYQNALRWKVSGDIAHGDTARNILNAWSLNLTTVTGNADRYLAAGLFGYQLANAAEMMRGYPGFDVERMQNMLWWVFYKPLNERFLHGNEYGRDHNDAFIENYWANWDLCNLASAAAISIFCDHRDTYEKAINYFKYGGGNGSIYHAVPYVHPDGLAQWQESGRDQGHTILGVGLMASVCEIAWSQGDDLYGWADNRFMKAAEYVARYNNGQDVPFSTYQWRSGTNGTLQTHGVISNAGRNEYRAVWEMIYNHYANRKGLAVPNIAARAASHRPEGGAYPGGHATTHDQIGFGTLSYTRPPGGGDAAALHHGNIGDGTYTIIARHSNKALQAAGTENGANVEQWTANGSANQQWTVTHLGGGEYRIASVPSGRALDVWGVSHDNGANVNLWDANGGINQRFAFVPLDGGHFRVIPAHSGKSMDVLDFFTGDGVNVLQWKNYGGHNQHWRLVPSAGTPQSAPALTASANHTQIQLSWTASPGATSYNVKRATANGGPYRIIAHGVTGTTFSDPDMSVATTYYYVVSPANATGEGTPSNQAAVTTIPAPTIMALAGNDQVRLRWNGSVGAASYTVKRSTTNGGPYTTVAGGVTATTYTDASAGNGTGYFYVVTAVNGGSESQSGQAAVTPNPSGLVHHWKFDATSGANAVNANSSPNGELSGGATWAAGRFNNAVSLNGSGGHVAFPGGIVSTLNDCTVAGWFRLNSAGTWARIFDFGSGTTASMYLTPRNGSGLMQFTIFTGSSGQDVVSTVSPAIGTWHHFAVTMSGTVAILYLDGVAVGRHENLSVKPFDLGNTSQNWIGRSQWPDPFLNGQVDDFRIYDYGLSASQVGALASSASPSPGTLSANAGNAQVSLSWSGLIEASSYNVIRATVSGGPYATIATGVTSTSHTDITAGNGTTYFYVVSAMIDGTETDDSGEAAATPNVGGLRHHWAFDESSGMIAPNSTSSPYGTLPGAATSWVAGRVSHAVWLNGTGSYVSFPSGFLSAVGDYTVSGWFNLSDGFATWSRIFDFGSGTSNYMFLTPQSGGNTFRFAINTGSGEQQINGPTIPAANVWNHFAITVSGNVGILYLNGVEVGRNNGMTLKPSHLGNTTQNWIGRSQFSADPYLNGRVDDLRIHTLGLSASEVATLASMNDPSPPMPPPALAITLGGLQLGLNWTAVPGATGYNVKRATISGGPYSTIASGVTADNHTDTGVIAGTKYYYVVSAANAAGESGHSVEVSETAGRRVSPGQPTTASSSEPGNIPANANDDNLSTRWTASSGGYPQWWRVDLGQSQPINRVFIHWHDAESRSYKYLLEISDDDVNYTTVVDQTGRTAMGNSTDVFNAAGRYLRITVTAVSPSGGWAAFDEVLVYNDTPTLPAVPAGLEATAVTISLIDLAWNASVGATGYNVKRATASGGPYSALASNVANAAYSDPTVTEGMTYYYVVSAVNAAGESADSTEAIASTAIVSPEPPPLGIVLQGNQLQITWPESHTGWRLEMQGNGLDPDGWTTVPGSNDSNVITFPLGGDAPASTFFRLAFP